MKKIYFEIVKYIIWFHSRVKKILWKNRWSVLLLCSIFSFQSAFAASLPQPSITDGRDQAVKATFRQLNKLKKFNETRWKSIISNKMTQERIISSLSLSQDEQLKKLSLYKKEIQGEYGKEMMIFLNMPTSEKWIHALAENMKNIIAEYKINLVKPIFLFEPYDEQREEIDFSYLKSGSYDEKLRLLFSLLNNTYHISSEDIGLVVPYPENNTPAYKRKGFVPEDFPLLIHSFFSVAREQYPTLEGWILLDSKSYDIGKKWWQGTFSSFMPYIRGIKPGTLSRFWIQWFPWVSNDGSIEAYNPKEYLPLGITLEASKYLSVKSIWYNTWVMKKKYRNNTITLTWEARDTILEETLDQWEKLAEKWYGIHIHIFAQNKFNQYEATDWSILGDIEEKNSFKKFITQAKEKNISVSVYDK